MSNPGRRDFVSRFSITIAIFILVGVSAGRRAGIQDAKSTYGPLRTEGSKIVDHTGATVGFSGLNWFGFETSNNAPHGLWVRNWQEVLDQIKSLGYNTLRLPFSNAMLNPGVMPTGIDYLKNPDLEGLTSLEVMDRLIEGAGKRGMWVILDNHRSTTGGGPESNGLWYTDEYPENRWIGDWKMLAARYQGSPAVVGVDLRNEPHDSACWGCGDADRDWRLAAERAGNAILAVNPDLLIIVEGVNIFNGQSTWWGGNLMGAKDYPVRLDIPNRLVYSAHEYPESVANQSWFSDPNYPDNLPEIWDQYWGYLANEAIAPVLIGEFGTHYKTDQDQKWLQTLQRYIQQKQLNWTFWSLNPNSGDTGGLLLDDWLSVDTSKQGLLAKIQYPFSGSPSQGPLPTPPGNPAPPPAPNASIWLPFLVSNFDQGNFTAWSPFKDPGSSVQTSLVSRGSVGDYALKVEYDIIPGGWGGVEQKFSSPQNWSAYQKIGFGFSGSNSRNRIRVELLDNRASGSAEDTAERYEYEFMDNFNGWKEFNLPLNSFQRRQDWQPAGAPNDGLGLKEVWGINFSPIGGRGVFLLDSVQLLR